MASLKDVAKRAGVSLMTVSRALNTPEKLKADTLAAVTQAIQELNYVPNFSAQNIRGSTNKTIGVLSLGTATTPFSVEILLAIEKTVRQHGWHAFIINAFEEDQEEVNLAVEHLLSHRPSAIIIARNGLKTVSIPAQLADFPLVLANCVSDDFNLPCYIPDDFQGQYDLSQLLVKQGYKRPLFLHIPENYIATKARKQGFEQAWENNPNAMSAVHFFMPPDGENYFDGAKPLLDLLEHRPDEFNFDVVICGNDRIAFVAYQALLSRGFRIPQDVAITGYDNMIGVSHLFLPPLTTVELPHYQIGEQAALHLIENRQQTSVVKLACPLIIGRSC